MKVWSVSYKGHTIRLESPIWGEARLFVDGELQDADFGFCNRLSGVIRAGDGAGEGIKVSLQRKAGVRCRIFVDHRLVE